MGFAFGAFCKRWHPLKAALACLLVIAGLALFVAHGTAASSKPDPPPKFASIRDGMRAATLAMQGDVQSENFDSAHPGQVGICYALINNVDYDYRNNVGQALAEVRRDRAAMARYLSDVTDAIIQLEANVAVLANDGAPRTGETQTIAAARDSIRSAELTTNGYIKAADDAARQAENIAAQMARRGRCPAGDLPNNLQTVPLLKVQPPPHHPAKRHR
jgi:hypothetical protein